MCSTIVAVLLALVSLALCDEEIKSKIEAYKQGIKEFDVHYVSRMIEEERLTNKAAIDATNSVPENFTSSLARLLTTPYKELETLQSMAQGTGAVGCFNGIMKLLRKTVADEMRRFFDCKDSAISKLNQVHSALDTLNNTYRASLLHAVTNIDLCGRTFHKFNERTKLEQCLNVSRDMHNAIAHAVYDELYVNSSSLEYFTESVIVCVNSSATAVSEIGNVFVEELVDCAKLTRESRITEYARTLNKLPAYADTLIKQINESLGKYYEREYENEQIMQNYAGLLKFVLGSQKLIPGNKSYYEDAIKSLLEEHYKTVATIEEDFSKDGHCIVDARTILKENIDRETNFSMRCNSEIRTNTQQHISAVGDYLIQLNAMIPPIGRAAIVSCFSRGYILANNTIAECYDLVLKTFQVQLLKKSNKIEKSRLILMDFINKQDEKFPCGEITMRNAILWADTAIYYLKRCLYMSSHIFGSGSDGELEHIIDTGSSSDGRFEHVMIR